MTEHVLDLSARFIDSGRADGPPNRVSHELSELTDGVALVEAFSHVVTVRTDDGLVAFGGRSHRARVGSRDLALSEQRSC